MGWTYQTKDYGKTPKQIMDGKYQWENDRASHKVLGSAMVGWSEYYAAVETTIKATGVKSVWAGVALVRNVPKAKDGYTFGYKDMDETVGPIAYRMPLRLLNLLTPTESKYANEWRDKVRAYHAKPKLKAGQRVVFTNPVKFTNGLEFSEFTYHKGSVFRSDAGGRYRITGWKDKDYKVLAESSEGRT